MKKKLKDFLPFLFFFALTFWVFRSWFIFKPLTAKDWHFFYYQNLRELPTKPYLWSNQGWGGMGRVSLYNWSIFYFYWLVRFLSFLGFSWSIIEKIIWFWPFLIFTVFSSWYLSKTFFPKNVFWLFGSLVFLFNTYILMLVGGGQIGTVMAYAVAPLVLGLFITTVSSRIPQASVPGDEAQLPRSGSSNTGVRSLSAKPNLFPIFIGKTPSLRAGGGFINLINELKSSRVHELKRLVLVGLAIAIQVMFDPRISFLTMGAVVLYCVFNIKHQVSSIKYLASLLVPTIIAVLLHFYWLLPAVIIRRPALPGGYGESGWVEFLSFADFSNSFSLLHPNWPENIFGKTYFMKPEFLILPILAFSSLLFIGKNGYMARWLDGYKNKGGQKNDLAIQPSNNMTILFFTSLALIGAFLAKGSKPPFGGVYLWLFKYFPGMNMFRDPTKFYTLVALSYSVLIPFSISKIYEGLKKRLYS